MGKVMLSGVSPKMTDPISGILAGKIAVGSTVKLMENGTAVEYLVVNQGIPSESTRYDTSCDGTWLLRKDIYSKQAWHSSNDNTYPSSTVHSYLNGTFFNLFDDVTKNTIKQVKVPFVNGNGYTGSVSYGSDGLSCRIFLLSRYEVYLSSGTSTAYYEDGVALSYFNSADATPNERRIAYYSGTATTWWLRSPYTNSSSNAHSVGTSGGSSGQSCSTSTVGVRPALIIPKMARFDETTMVLKGVA